jgi:hypothetical protein
MVIVERGDATGAWYWKGLPTRTLAFDGCVLPGINHLKDTLWSCVVEMYLEITN